MNPSLQWRDRIGQVSHAIRAELDQLVANIGTGWAVEHDDQGHHTTINASGPCACAQVKLRGYVELDLRNGVAGRPLAVPADVSFVSIKTPGAGVLDVYGISQVGQKAGDILFLRRSPNGSGAAVQLHDRATATFTPLGTEIYLDSEVSASYPAFLLTGASWVPLVYSPDSGTNHTAAWCVLQVVSL